MAYLGAIGGTQVNYSSIGRLVGIAPAEVVVEGAVVEEEAEGEEVGEE